MRASVAVVLPTCRGYTLPAQDIPVDWIIVHDQTEREIQNDGYGYCWWNSYEGTMRDELWRLDDESGLRVPAAPSLSERRVPCAARRVQDIVAPEPSLYGSRTSAIRQAGLDAAYDAGYEYVLTVDDDCVLPLDWARSHVVALRGSVPLSFNTVPGAVIRGNTVGTNSPVGISHGLWSGVLDYPAWYQLACDPGPCEIEDRGWTRIGTPFPMCGMNVGFRREVLPAVYFQHQFLRHDDIFAGWVAQRLLDICGYAFVNGGAVVQHDRASNAEANLKKELPGDDINGSLLKHILRFHCEAKEPRLMFMQMVCHLTDFNAHRINATYRRMVEDMSRWATRKENER